MPRLLFLMVLLFISTPSKTWAVGSYRFLVPNGDRFGCTLCHLSNPPTSPFTLNPFGRDVRVSFASGGGKPQWDEDLAKKDSDGDGYTNGEELQEATGHIFAWSPRRIGGGDTDWDVSSGIPSLVRNPGDGTLSVPTLRFDPIGADNYAIYVNGVKDASRTRTDSIGPSQRPQSFHHIAHIGQNSRIFQFTNQHIKP
jgi:hypothetical protein